MLLMENYTSNYGYIFLAFSLIAYTKHFKELPLKNQLCNENCGLLVYLHETLKGTSVMLSMGNYISYSGYIFGIYSCAFIKNAQV